MQHFSESDIREAKERVREMRRRASAYIDEEEQGPAPADEPRAEQESKAQEAPSPAGEVNQSEQAAPDPPGVQAVLEGTAYPKPEPMVPDPNVGEDQSMIILMLIFLLSQDEADNMLVLALLYLLF